MYKKYFLTLFPVLLYLNINAQLLKVGFRVEPEVMITERNNSSSFSFSPYGFYLSVIVEPIEKFSFEMRPGYMITEEYYGGHELGVFLRWIIPASKFYLSAGLNNHSNTFTNSHNSGSCLTKKILFKGIGLGYHKDSKLGIDLTYYWTDDKEYAHSRLINSNGSYSFVNKKVSAIIKIGFSLTWDIL